MSITLLDERESKRFLGIWEKSIPYVHSDFAEDELYDEPHAKRRIAVLEAHPEIRSLYGKCPTTFLYLLIAIAVHGLFGWICTHLSLFPVIFCSFVVGGSICQLCGIIIHEAVHGLIFTNSFLNTAALIIANTTIPIPIAASFRRYHLDHHAFQGVKGKDPDLPLEFELYLVKGSPLKKTLWIFIYPFLYILRGASIKKSPTVLEAVNWIFIITLQLALYNLANWNTSFIIYTWLSLYFGFSIHPAAAHSIQEHFTWKDGQETYSYYGPLNPFFLNIGYHNEHHDFAQVPWNKLPEITKSASEFYTGSEHLSHPSWIKVFTDFIFSKELGPQSRVARSYDTHVNGRNMISSSRLTNKHKG